MPIAFGPTLYSRTPLLSGDAGVEQTINQMRAEVNEALADPVVIRQARDIVSSVPAFDDFSEARALYDWVHQRVRFTKDPLNKETLMKPGDLVRWIQQDGAGAGDCDDISMLLGTLLMAVGYPARLMTVAAGGDEFSHVYVEGQINGQWVPMDPARSDSQFGVAPPVTSREKWWSLADNSSGELKGFLGNYPRFRSHMGSYGRVRTVAGMGALGDCAPGDVWTGAVCVTPASGDSTSSSIATISQGTADIIRASEGLPASPFSYTSGPYASFQTPYSPGGVPAGYAAPAPGISLSGSSNWLLWGALLVGAAMMLGGRHR